MISYPFCTTCFRLHEMSVTDLANRTFKDVGFDAINDQGTRVVAFKVYDKDFRNLGRPKPTLNPKRCLLAQTVVQRWDGARIWYPNTKLLLVPVFNVTRTESRRLVFKVRLRLHTSFPKSLIPRVSQSPSDAIGF